MTKEMGNRVDNITNWGPVTDDKYKQAQGKDAIRYRQMETYAKIEGNKFADHSYSTNHYMLIEQSATKIIIQAVVTSKGFPHAEDFEILTKWEVLSPFEGSGRVVFGHSYSIHWLHKPKIIGKIIDKSVNNNIKDSVKEMRKFFVYNGENYSTLMKLSHVDSSDVGSDGDGSSSSSAASDLLQEIMTANKNRIDEMTQDFKTKLDEAHGETASVESEKKVLVIFLIIVSIFLALSLVCMVKMKISNNRI